MQKLSTTPMLNSSGFPRKIMKSTEKR